MLMNCVQGVKPVTMCLVCLRPALQHGCWFNCYPVLADWMNTVYCMNKQGITNNIMHMFMLTRSKCTATGIWALRAETIPRYNNSPSIHEHHDDSCCYRGIARLGMHLYVHDFARALLGFPFVQHGMEKNNRTHLDLLHNKILNFTCSWVCVLIFLSLSCSLVLW